MAVLTSVCDAVGASADETSARKLDCTQEREGGARPRCVPEALPAGPSGRWAPAPAELRLRELNHGQAHPARSVHRASDFSAVSGGVQAGAPLGGGSGPRKIRNAGFWGNRRSRGLGRPFPHPALMTAEWCCDRGCREHASLRAAGWAPGTRTGVSAAGASEVAPESQALTGLAGLSYQPLPFPLS